MTPLLPETVDASNAAVIVTSAGHEKLSAHPVSFQLVPFSAACSSFEHAETTIIAITAVATQVARTTVLFVFMHPPVVCTCRRRPANGPARPDAILPRV